MNIAYIRVSTLEQNEARQMEGLKKYEVDKIFQEKVSAKDTNRPQLKAMLDFAREGDTIYVWDFSRLAKREGKFRGRKEIDYPDNWQEIYIKWKNRKMTANEAMKILRLKRNTFYKLIKKYNR